MAIMTGMVLDIDLRVLNHALHKHQATEQTHARLQEAYAEALELFAPKVVYRWCEVSSLANGMVELRAETNSAVLLTMGQRAELLSVAQKAVAAVSTIGDALDREVQRLNGLGEYPRAYYLDCIGVAALAETTSALERLVEAEAEQQGLGVGLRLSPGSLEGWALADQAVLHELAGGGDAGVGIDAGGALIPLKSAACVIGVGPAYTNNTVGRACRYCNLVKDCWRAEV